MIKSLLGVALCLGTSTLEASVEQTTMIKKEPFIHYETAELKNGLKIVVIPNGALPVVTVGMIVHVGTADDPVDQVGLSHFLEHMMFSGTKKIPDDQFNKIILKNGGHNNAFTEYDMTFYYTTIHKAHMGRILQMEADRLRNLSFTHKKVDSEKKVVLEERGMRVENHPFGSMFERYLQVTNPYHPYGIPPIGYPHHIQKYNYNSTRNHYDAWYQPNNTTLVIVGGTTMDEVKPLVEKYFKSLKKKGTFTTPQRIANPNRDGVTHVIRQKNPRNAMQILSWSYDVPNYSKVKDIKEYYALCLLDQMLAGHSLTPLYVDLVDESEQLLNISSHYDGDGLDPRSFSITATINPKHKLDDIKDKILDKIKTHIKNLDEENLKLSKKVILNSISNMFDGNENLASNIALMLGHQQSLDDLNHFEKNINEVTLEEVKSVAEKYLKDPHSVLEIMPAS
ncbi:MAG: hypothetical protein C0432_00155 [Candidatus Puniceispirillum sp.]|nr:hypothetical protein [Candidatus Pelagibacter sp.]MBA4282695.1 hypothetical protein [Candidatus Puniceispirillum sp.]